MVDDSRLDLTVDETLRKYVSEEAILIPKYDLSENDLNQSTLEHIKEWLEDGSASPAILWISGLRQPSSVRTIISLCLSKGVLGGSFSFSTRKGAEQAQSFVTTIAYQMATNVSTLRSLIHSAMLADPRLPERPIDIQFQRLLSNPLESSAACSLSAPPLIVIDGLEMYQDDRTRRNIISLIEMSITATKLPIRYLFTSQPAVDKNYIPGLHPGTHLHIDASALTVASQHSIKQLSLDQLKKTYPRGFPELVSVHQTVGSSQSYCRSMMMLGHGFPLWNPLDVNNDAYAEQGVQIGDIAYITGAGQYRFCFNIFEPRDSALHSHVRPDQRFEPIQPRLDSSDVLRVDEIFAKGEVLFSNGVTVKTESEPLSVRVLSNNKDGSILVLPDGATREDLVSTRRFHDYVRKWAPYWYQDQNISNGSLFLVTGCDKASDWALATFPQIPTQRESKLCYRWLPNNESGWVTSLNATTNCPVSPSATRNQCVFVRSMRISLGGALWSSAVPDNGCLAGSHSTVLYKPPALNYLANVAWTTFRLAVSPVDVREKMGACHFELFHPNFAIAQILLAQYPQASIALVNDKAWIDLAKSGNGTLEEIKALTKGVFRNNTITNDDGVLYLSDRATNTIQANDKTRKKLFHRDLGLENDKLGMTSLSEEQLRRRYDLHARGNAGVPGAGRRGENLSDMVAKEMAKMKHCQKMDRERKRKKEFKS